MSSDDLRPDVSNLKLPAIDHSQGQGNVAARPDDRAEQARRFFDRPAPRGYLREWSDRLTGVDDHNPDHAPQRGLLFRLGGEWLALPATSLEEVTRPLPIHRLPHRDRRLGLVNLRGQLKLWADLEAILGVAASVPQSRPLPIDTRTDLAILEEPHMIFVKFGRASWVLPCRQVVGIIEVPETSFEAVPANLPDTVRHCQALFAWQGQTVGWLDIDRLDSTLGSLVR